MVRFLRDMRGPRFRAAPAVSMPIETAPAEEAQFDWSECSAWTERWGLGEVWCFGAILCWSRWRWWFTTSIDAEHTFEGLVGFFEAAGGVPRIARTDRMGALGRSQGKRFSLHRLAIDFARHHSLEIKVCKTADAKRKGKTERPFRTLKESFLTACDALGAPRSLSELNARGRDFLDRRSIPGPTRRPGWPPRSGSGPSVTSSSPCSGGGSTPPTSRTAASIRLALVDWGGVAYSVPPEALGSKVTCRVEVDSDILEVGLSR